MIAKDILSQYEPTIGIECHVQLRTNTKLFSSANNDARDAAPNTTVSPVCFGLPGTLPVLNREAVTLAIRAGIALNADIASVSSFDRKHYFYPDLPKGYQITQLERPTVGKGEIEVPLADGSFKVRITRAHIEEDAGKLTHPDGADYSLVDLNRAGTPLIEVVSEADMHSAAEAKAYAQELYLLMKYAGVTYGDLYHGNMRFDVNVSVAKKGAVQWGTRAEVKNLNSFRSVERAVLYEFERQVELLEKGEKVVQETRGWHDAKQKTFAQRSKENAHDYRYFPDADLPPVEITPTDIEAVRTAMPRLPSVLRAELAAKGIDSTGGETLILRDALDGTAKVKTVLSLDAQAAQFAAKFIINRAETAKLPTTTQFADAHALFAAKELSSNNADELLFALAKDHAATARAYAQKAGLLQQNDSGELEKIVAETLADPVCRKAVEDVKNGEIKAIGFLVGQIMKRSGGKANPAIAGELVRAQLGL